MGYFFHFSHYCVCVLAYLNFNAVLALPKTARSAQTQKSISFIWIVWSTLYVYLWRRDEKNANDNCFKGAKIKYPLGALCNWRQVMTNYPFKGSEINY